ncbi:phosphate acetyltransferase [Longivirga aurantiaca]|uniref:Phosphate acetyltransferase n=1 Tax=Longivirga aurantiaca TaxID=1837743 RepID=A0ABW1T211_9ACTN
MSESLYITSASPRAGKAVAALGVLELLARRVDRIGLFRPLIDGDGTRDALVELLVDRYDLDVDLATACPMTYADAARHLESGHQDAVVTAAVEAFTSLRQKYDFVLVLGTDYTGPAASTELDLNATLAANLGTPVLSVVSAWDSEPDDVPAAVAQARHVLADHGCTLVGTLVNRADPVRRDEIEALLVASAPDEPVWVLPDLPVLSALTVDEVATALDGTVLAGEPADLQREVDRFVAGSAHVPNVLPLLDTGVLLVAAGDRADLAVAMAAFASSPDLPTPAGLVVTLGLIPDPLTQQLLRASRLPVVAVELDTYAALHEIEGLRGEIRAGSRRKIAAALGEFSAHVDTERLASRIRFSTSETVTPLMFAVDVLERARADRKRIVLPEGTDERILRAAEELLHGRVVDLVLLGDPGVIAAKAAAIGVDISAAEIIDPARSPLLPSLAARYAELRAHKGVTLGRAHDRVIDPSYFGTLLVETGRVDGMVSGATHTTAETIRPALEVIKTVPGVSLVSSTFLMCLPDRVLAFADCAVNVDPSAEQLADIASSTADTAAAFGIVPRVAMVSYSTGESGSGIDVEKVRLATSLLVERRPDLPVAGPIQYDAAVDPAVGASKMPGNDVAGHATVLVFPDLNTGNATYKAVQRSAEAVAVGPVLQGLRRPVNDLSRGCTVPDIVNTVAITAIQAQSVAPASRG